MSDNVQVIPTEELENTHTRENNTITVFPFEYVEALLGQSLASIFHAIDSLKPEHQERLSMTRIENVKASASIVYMECKGILDCLEPYHDASLNPKHRLIRVMLRCATKVLECSGLAKARTTRHKECLAYARLAKDLLTTFHKVFHPATPQGEREDSLAQFLVDHGPPGRPQVEICGAQSG